MSTYIQHFSHDHHLRLKFIKLHRSSKVSCDLCQLEIFHNDQGYTCSDCDYVMHKACAEMPQYIDHSFHTHHNPLRLDKRSSNNPSMCYYCDNSFEEKENLAYVCDQCSLHMHVTCALIPLPTITSHGNEDADVVHYLCHQNMMALVEQDNCKSQAKCFACQSFWSGLAYSCTFANCKNFLHKSCAEFPGKIQHPFHSQHPLTLQVSKPQACKLCCKKDCRLTFSCHSGCSFNLGIECVFLRANTVKCQSHDHLLSFVENAFCDIQCDACRKSYTKWNDLLVAKEVNHTQSLLFRCMECDFNLHFLCGPLPPMIEYDYHIHPSTLVDHFATEDASNEYYCDVCEEERNRHFRFYYCEDCKYTAHIHCLMSEIMKVIKGKTTEVELMALGENPWYQFGTEKEMLKENELTLREVMCNLSKEENERLVDPYAFGHPSSFKTNLEERYSFYRRENSPLFDHELPSIEDINRINQFFRFGSTDFLNFILELRYYTPKEGLKLDERYLRQKVADVEGYMVPITVAPILKTLLHKHGSDLFGGGHASLTCGMKSVTATLLCVVIDRIYNTNIEDITRDDLKDWFFCLKAIKEITDFGILGLDNFLETVIVPAFLGSEAIRYEKDISEKLDLRITYLEAALERTKEARRIFKTQTSKRSDEVKDYVISEALKWKGKKVNETTSSGVKITEYAL